MIDLLGHFIAATYIERKDKKILLLLETMKDRNDIDKDGIVRKFYNY